MDSNLNDSDISGATSSTYTLVAGDADTGIKVRVSFTDDRGNTESLTTESALIVTAANSPATGAPTISGTAQVGETLTASTSGISDSDGLTSATFTYQWLADDAAISGATGSTYTLVAADSGKAIKVQVSFTDDRGNTESLTSVVTAAVTAVNSPATGAPTISGTAQAGETLTASTTGITDSDGLTNATFTYQWLADDAAISGATGSIYTLVAADSGKAIKVQVSFTDDAGNTESLTSAATSAVEAAAQATQMTASVHGVPASHDGSAAFTLVNEMRSFPLGTHDDQVDSMSGAMTALTQQDRVQSVLPRSMVQLCVDAYRKYEREIGRIVAAERPFVGFRVAETGADHTSMVMRIGPAIVAAEQWEASYTATLDRVDRHCREVGAAALYYDAGGSGASIRANLRQMWQERGLSQSYRLTGVNFGGAVEGAKTEFVRGQTNAQYFARRSSQLAWTLRLWATRTKRLMEGDDIDLGTCLVIDPAIEGLDGFLAQLSQPEFDETSTGKVEIPTSTTCAGIRLTGAMLP